MDEAADAEGQGAAAPKAKLSVRGLAKHYGSSVALDDVDLDVFSGELLTLLGPSGSGKTTLLQLVAGLVAPTRGKLVISGVDQLGLQPHRRDVGVVFQSYSLFPHLTVRENVSFPLEVRRWNRSERASRVSKTLEMVGLGDFAARFPHELSGGQQQRVALARCLVYQPSLILMDEPFSALDRKLREAMQIEVKRIHRETGATIIFVTHDQEEALALSDRVCLMRGGRVEQIGTPAELYDFPRTVFTAEFIGVSNFITGTLSSAGAFEAALLSRPIQLAEAGAAGNPVTVSVRPEAVYLGAPGEGLLDGIVVEQIYVGAETRLLVDTGDEAVFTARVPSGRNTHRPGEAVSLAWNVEAMRVLLA